MKRFYANIKSLISSVLMMAIITGSAVSCAEPYDDTNLRNQIEVLRQELELLRAELENQINSLKAVVDGMVTVSKVDTKNGTTTVTLSDGSKIVVYPRANVPSEIVTIVYYEGVPCWAIYKDGNTSLIEVDGRAVPVYDVAPVVRTNNGAIEVSFDGGNSWIVTGYEKGCAVVDAKVVYSEWQTDKEGNPLALYCELTLIDGSIVKVGMRGGKIILANDSVYVPYGTEREFLVQAEDAADFMLEKPAGWGCEVEYDVDSKSYFFNFTSPTFEAVAAGEAENNGIVKLMVVFEDGSSSIARIYVTTEPAKIRFLPDEVRIDAGYGCDYMMFGMLPASIYKLETVINLTSTVLGGQSHDRVKEIGFFETTTATLPMNEVYSSPLTAGTEYVFWYVVPRYHETTGEMYIEPNDVVTIIYKHNTRNFEVVEPSFFDVNIKFDVAGTDGYVVGYSRAEEYDAAEIVRTYNASVEYFEYYMMQDQNYEGSFVELFDNLAQPLAPGVEYTAWLLLRNAENTYEVADIQTWNFSTSDFQIGGSLEIEEGEADINFTTIDVELNTTGHITLYYNIVPSYEASAYPTDEAAIAMLRRDGVMMVTDQSVVAHYNGKSSGEKVTLFAVAVDQNGLFGKVFKKDYTTKTIEYNSIDVKLTMEMYKANDTRIRVEGEGAQKYLYLVVRTKDEAWTTKYGGSISQAGFYIAMNPTANDVRHTDVAAYALQDGCICINDLMAEEEYAIVVMAMDAEGMVSKPEGLYFTTIANIGNVVYANDPNWAVGKPEVTIGNIEELEFFSFEWYVAPVEGYTAYTLAEFPSNFTDPIYGYGVDTPEKLISFIISNGTMCEYSDDYSRRWWEYVWSDAENTYVQEWFEVSGLPGVYNMEHYGTRDVSRIYTTWCDPDGNFHEAFVVDPSAK